MNDLRQMLAAARARLDGDAAALEAELLLAAVLQQSRSWLYAHADVRPTPAQAARFEALVARRAAGEPVAYLLGRRAFWTFELEVGPACLIPRPETELLLEQALRCLPADSALPVADLGTGSGALALALAIRHPQRVRRLVLMGSVGVPFPITKGLDDVWGYTPSIDAMRGLLDYFAYSRALVNDELAQLRYLASIRPGFQESFSAMFPAPRQRWVDAMASSEADIRALPHEALVLHGREDQVIPLSNSLTLAQWIPNVQLHVFGHCGHWTQIEHADRFNCLVGDFLDEADRTQP